MPYIVSDAVREPLYAIVPYFNPWRWQSREKHTLRAVKHFVDSGAVVYLVEIAFNRREFAFEGLGLNGTEANCQIHGKQFQHKHIQLRTKDELWLKENAINQAVQHLPHDWQQVCWLDSDVHFVRPNWVGETIHKLQHYSFLQMFSHARDLSPSYEVMPEMYPHADGSGFVRAWMEGALSASPELDSAAKHHHPGGGGGRRHKHHPLPYPPRVWPGLAWACTRGAWDAVGGLIDFAVWGGADYHMAFSLVEQPVGMMRKDLHPNYQNMVMEWYERCKKHIRQNVGFMEGSIFHHWHGRKTDRGYNAKHALLAQIGFDPLRHLKRDFQGLWQLNDDGSDSFMQLRDGMRRIALERDEDSPDTRLDLWDQGH